MGTWGTSLYDNDTTCDIRGDYLDKLKRGKSDEDATQELIDEHKEIFGSIEEPLFWFALSDTQWQYGRLTTDVKEKAQFFLSQEYNIERWERESKNNVAWKNTLNGLMIRLMSPMPKRKKISLYKFFKCPWNIGDVYAYKFCSDYSINKSFKDKFIVFRKVSENIVWPGHIVPVVQVFKWIGEQLPNISYFSHAELLVQNMIPATLRYRPDYERKYTISLISTSEKDIPINNLYFLGNLFSDELNECRYIDHFAGCRDVGWEGKGFNRSFESYIIDQYLAWECDV